MNAAQVLKQLESLGTAQNRKVYARHGAREPMFGVSFAHLGKLAKELAGAHELACELWASGNHDARVLATMIADPSRLRSRELEAWVRGVENHVLCDAVAKLAAQSPDAGALQAKWLASSEEWKGASGWGLLCWRLQQGEPMAEAELARHLATIEAGIHRAKNRVRYAMNGALIGIGIASPALRPEALAIAKRVGRVEVDHGETGCKTPNAAQYIQKVLAHRDKKKASSKTSRRPVKRAAKR